MKQITLNYSESIVKESVKAFWWKQIGVSYLVALSFLAFVLIYLILTGERSWFVGIIATILVIGISVIIGSYILFYYRSMNRLKRMSNKNAVLELSQDFFRITSNLGSTEIKWSLITKIQILTNCWLIYFSESETMTWPTVNLEKDTLDEMLSFIRNKNIKFL